MAWVVAKPPGSASSGPPGASWTRLARQGSAGAAAAPARPRRYLLLRVATVVGPLAFLALLDAVRHAYFSATLHTLPGTVLIGLVLVVAATVFSGAVFRGLERLQRTIVRQSTQMAALEEHDRLAREINDDFLQRMYGIGLGLHACLYAADRLPPDTAEDLRYAVAELDRTIDAMRAYLLAPAHGKGGSNGTHGRADGISDGLISSAR